MKYIRTKDTICETKNVILISSVNDRIVWTQKINKPWFYIENVKQADTIEELICDDDILYIYDLYPDAVLVVEGNVKPFGYQTKIKLKEWLSYKPKFDLFIKDSNGNYTKMAKTNNKGELKLL